MTLSLLARSVAVDEALAFLRLPVDGRLPDQLARQRLRPAFLLLACLLGLVLAGLALSPKLAIPVNDKVLHALGSGLFTAAVYPILLPSSPPEWAMQSPLLATSIAGGLVMGLGSEFAQASLSRRIFDWGDVAANLVGFAVALGLSHRFSRPWLAKVQRSEPGVPLQDEEARGLVS